MNSWRTTTMSDLLRPASNAQVTCADTPGQRWNAPALSANAPGLGWNAPAPSWNVPALSWNAPALWQQLLPLLPGLTLEVLASAGSTNSLLLDRVRQGDASPCLLVAESQTDGRGRHGRVWQSAPGASLTFSLALPLLAADWSGLSLAIGLALAQALDPLDLQPPPTAGRPPRVVLKWPNDLLLSPPPDRPEDLPRKLGGILIESLPLAGQRIAIIGIGLNIAPRPESSALPGLSQGYACLQELQPGVTAAQALAHVAAPLLEMLKTFEDDGFAPLCSRYAARDWLAGRQVTTTLADLPEGLAEGVAGDGALWLRAAGRRHRVVSGEVSVRAAQAAPAIEPANLPALAQDVAQAAMPERPPC